MELKTILISFGFMFILIITGTAIGDFFDIGHLYYIPFIMWAIALTIFNLILSKSHENIYLKDD
jgi:hypothetical protein